MDKASREEEWAVWMRAAIAGDAVAYRRFLEGVTPYLRAVAIRCCERYRAPRSEAEDIVQDVLLAIHLKRASWDSTRPIGPWMSVIVRNRLIDTLRRRGRHITVPIDDLIDEPRAQEPPDDFDRIDAARVLARLRQPQRGIVQAISLEGRSVRETADRLGMSEGAVRVALHRALKALAALYRSSAR